MELAVANKDFHLDEESWNELERMVEILGLFAKKMEYLQKVDISLADVVGVWLELENALKKKKENPLAALLLEKLIRRKEEFEVASNDVTVACMFLDLRFSFILSPDEKVRARKHLIYLWQKLRLRTNEFEREHSPQLNTTEEEMEIDNNEDELEQILKTLYQNDDAIPGTIPTEDLLLQEIEKFDKLGRVKATDNIALRWETEKFTFPILYQLAKMIMAVAPTEVSVERNFSTLDFILTKRRNRLTDENLEAILFIKLNSTLLDEVFED